MNNINTNNIKIICVCVCVCIYWGDLFEIFPDAAEKVLQLHCLFSLPDSQRQQGMTHIEPENERQEDRDRQTKQLKYHKRGKIML